MGKSRRQFLTVTSAGLFGAVVSKGASARHRFRRSSKPRRVRPRLLEPVRWWVRKFRPQPSPKRKS